LYKGNWEKKLVGCENQIKFGFNGGGGRIQSIHGLSKSSLTAAVLLAWGCGPPLLLHSHANHKYTKQSF